MGDRLGLRLWLWLSVFGFGFGLANTMGYSCLADFKSKAQLLIMFANHLITNRGETRQMDF